MSAALEQQARELFPFGQVDHMAWAKRIIWRKDQGDKDLMMVQLQFARQALGMVDNERG